MRVIGASKIYTGVAILKLIELKKLQSINCKVFENGGILNNYFQIPPVFLPNFQCISSRLLLTHASGLSTCKDEPIFFNENATQTDVINFLMQQSNLFPYAAGIYHFESFIKCNLDSNIFKEKCHYIQIPATISLVGLLKN